MRLAIMKYRFQIQGARDVDQAEISGAYEEHDHCFANAFDLLERILLII